MTIPRAPADRLDAVVRACARPGFPAASSAARPTSTRSSSSARLGSSADAVARPGGPAPDRLLPRDPARQRLPVAVRPLRLADPRARDAVALHRRAEARPDLALDLRDRAMPPSAGTRAASRRSTRTCSRRSGGSTTSSTAYAAIKYTGVIVMTSAIFPAYFLARMIVSRPWALFAAVGAVATPALAYAPFLVEEPAAYPWATLVPVPDRQGARRAGRAAGCSERRQRRSSPRSCAASSPS